MRLYSDVIKNKVVIMSSFFATCTGVCVPLNRNLRQLQDALGERLGKDAYIVCITVDPVNDTPEKLAEYAENSDAKPGWYFLSGDVRNVQAALRKLGFYVESREQHSNLFYVGNDKTGLWKKAFGLAEAGELIPIVESVLADGARS